MNTSIIFILFFILNFLFSNADVLKCGEEEIENCSKCGTGEKANTCIECKDKHFLFFHNLICLPCDHSIYGQVGCGGNCDATNYETTRNVLCNENDCKEGFYNLNGICFNCSVGLPNCKNCSITINGNEDKIYICNECLNNEYKLNQYGQCVHCSLSNCQKCHYNENSIQECDKCNNGFYFNNNKECIKCKDPKRIDNGFCRVCSDNENDYESGECWCDKYYTLKDHSTCINCPNNCSYCIYNKETNNAECIRCNSSYTLNSQKTCTYCGDGCEYCNLSEDSTPVCTLCFSRTFSSDGTKCVVCPNNCKTCNYDKNGNIKCIECNSHYALLNNGTCKACPEECYSCYANNNDEIACSKCNDLYALNPNKECVLCSNVDEEGMEGCEKCRYNEATENYECSKCKQKEKTDSYSLYDIYTYVTNNFRCFNNSNPEEPSFYGCLKAYHNSTTNKYECLECNNNYKNYIYIENEKICKEPSVIDLIYCEKAENIGTNEDPLYSCLKCYENSAKIVYKENNKINCYHRTNGNLNYCLEGEKNQNDIVKCTKCVPNSHLNSSNICECDSDSFGKYSEYCYKCDDKILGIPGCKAEKGCSNYYYSNDQLNCNECKDGYFNYTEGQCFSCSFEISNCEKCHFDDLSQNLICDQCPEGYSYNSNEKKCEIKNCEDFPEISEGCLICEGKIEEYTSRKKCQKCKPGYFKTKDEQCINCKLEKYGGSGCIKCKYGTNENGEETEEIICDYCPKIEHVLGLDGKCYNCLEKIKACEVCEFIKNSDNSEKLICKICKPGFYLNSEGECINYLKYLESITNCEEYSYKINEIMFCTYLNYNNYYYSNTFYCQLSEKYSNYYSYDSVYDYLEDKHIIDFSIPEVNSQFKGQCIRCQYDFYLTSEGKCEGTPSLGDCNLNSIVENFPEKYKQCRNLCDDYKNIYIDLIYNKDENNYENGTFVKLELREFFDYFLYNTNKKINEEIDENLKYLFIKTTLCIPRNGSFSNCKAAKYDEISNSYLCSQCYSDNDILDIESNSCIYPKINKYDDYKYSDFSYDCIYENIGTSSNPIFSCTKCYDDLNHLLVSTENNVKYCIYKDDKEIKNCREANIDTTYINSFYNCTNCEINFIPYKSKFFGRTICQNIFENITKKKEISLEKYEGVEYINATNGICEKNNFFTPDGEKCYSCNNEAVGMPGCKGACSFSLERNINLKCEEGCETGYAEVSDGVCQSCDSINHGCYECHYEEEYPANYTKLKRKRRFICDFCENNYIKLDDKCLTCEDLDLYDCDECQIDPKNNSNYICTKCNNFSILENGNCKNCEDRDEFQINNHCFKCSQFEEGGIKGCDNCEKKDNGQLICQICLSGFILLTNNYTCLNISQNKELEKFDLCEQITLDNNQLFCSKCKEEYTLLKDSNNEKGKCVQLPILFDIKASNFKSYYIKYYHDYFYYYNYVNNRYTLRYEDDYYYYESYNNYPCQEAVNLGTEEKPFYSCLKCYETFIYEKAYIYTNYYTRIINPRNNASFCIYQKEELENCTEALNITKDRIEKYDCLKCCDENKLVYDYDTNVHYCQYKNTAKKCMVKYCKTCKSSNNYFCNECLLSNYEVNSLSGECVEKSEVVPAITWKDIFRLEMNSEKTINGETINVPTLRLRGITTSQINTRHAFLIYLTFKIKISLIRNLEEDEIEKKIPAICQAINNVDESSIDVNMIDYECVGNETLGEDTSKYQLNEIAEGENDGLLKKSNLNELAEEKTIEELVKEEPIFTIVELFKYVTFEMNEVNNQTTNNYNFNFTIEGSINKEISPKSIDAELELNDIKEKANCNFNIEEDKKANLNCKLNIDKYKAKKLFTFKTSEIITEDNEFYLAKLDEVVLINSVEDEKEEKEEKKEKNNIAIIVICIVVGVLVIVGLIALTIYLIKKNKAKKQYNENQRKNVENIKKIEYEDVNPNSKSND